MDFTYSASNVRINAASDWRAGSITPHHGRGHLLDPNWDSKIGIEVRPAQPHELGRPVRCSPGLLHRKKDGLGLGKEIHPPRFKPDPLTLSSPHNRPYVALRDLTYQDVQAHWARSLSVTAPFVTANLTGSVTVHLNTKSLPDPNRLQTALGPL